MNTKLIPVVLEDGSTILIEAVVEDREQDVSLNPLSFKNTVNSIKAIVKSLVTPLKELQLGKITMEIEMGFTVETSKILSMLAASSASSSIKLTVEFDKK